MSFLTKQFDWDALYDDAALPVIKKKYPKLAVEDARDGFHPDRVLIKVPGVTNEEFYKFALEKGFAGVLLGFEFQLRNDPEFAQAMRIHVHDLNNKPGKGD